MLQFEHERVFGNRSKLLIRLATEQTGLCQLRRWSRPERETGTALHASVRHTEATYSISEFNQAVDLISPEDSDVRHASENPVRRRQCEAGGREPVTTTGFEGEGNVEGLLGRF